MQRKRTPLAPIIGFLAALLILAPSCATQRQQKAASLVNYVNQNILTLAPMETQALEQYAAVTGENYRGDQEVRRALENDVIPTYERFHRSLREIPVEDPEIASLHSLYVRSASLLLDGFKMKRLAIGTGDERLMETANARIERGREEGLAWRARLEELAAQYKVREEKK
jgi:hypothetical protein